VPITGSITPLSFRWWSLNIISSYSSCLWEAWRTCWCSSSWCTSW